MPYTLDEFCRDCRDALAADPGPGGREAVRRHLERLLANRAFVAETLGPEAAPGAHTLYRDPEFDFVVLAHVNETAHRSPPHDHGSSWAVYGQAAGYTEMTEYRRTDGGSGAGRAALERLRTYRLTPGKAGRYDVGDIHAIDYPDKARFVRVTGTDLAQVERLKYDTAAGQAVVIENASAS